VDHQKAKRQQRIRRAHRVRKKLTGTAQRPRLTIRRSLQNIYCQVIDDAQGKTLVSASSREKELRQQIKYGGNCAAAAVVGKAIAERIKAVGIDSLCLDRGPCKYHGRVAALANAMREAGIHV
jgi:large subunit ribosomal protein L18